MSENEDRKVTPLQPETAAPKGRVSVRHIVWMAALAALMILILCLLLFRDHIGRSVRTEEVRFSYDEGKQNAFTAFQGSLTAVTGGGMTVFDPSGVAAGTVSHVYAAPLLLAGDRLAMACDVGGSRLTVMEPRGTAVLDLETEGTLLDADLSASGALCYAELGQEDRTVLTVYDRKQNQIYRWNSSSRCFSQCAVSDDAEWLCAVALSGENGVFESRAVLFRTDQEEPLTEVSLGGQLILELRFLDPDTVCAIGEKSAISFTLEGELLGEYDYGDTYLRDYAIGRDGLVVLALNPFQAGSRYSLVTLDRSGAALAERYVGEEILSLSAAGDRCAILTPASLMIYDKTLTLCASTGELDDASAAVLLDDGSAILLGGGTGRFYLPS